MSEFERIVTFSPAYDKRAADPKKNYGIHGVNLRMVLRGPLGATQFLLFTDWHLPHVRQWLKEVHGKACEPNPADKGYHWSTPQYEGQESHECDLLPGGKCYCDGSGLNAEDTFELLISKGDEGVWEDLRKFYDELAADSTAQREAANE